MKFIFRVEVEVERLQGKFASRDELFEQVSEALSDANPNTITGENDGEYEVTTWEVEEVQK